MTAASFIARVVSGTCSTSASTQQFTSPGLGTPKGAVIFVTRATALDSLAAHAVHSTGFADGTNQCCQYGYSRDSNATSESGHNSNSASLIRMVNPTGGGASLDCEAVFSQWVTDGIEISWSTNPPSAFEIVVLLIGGVDAEATVVFDASSPASVGGTTTHSVGHQVDLCLAAGKSAGREMWQSFGASDGTTNVGILGLSDHGTAAGNTRSYTYQDRVFHTMSIAVPPAADTSQSGIALVNFTSSGLAWR